MKDTELPQMKDTRKIFVYLYRIYNYKSLLNWKLKKILF